MSFAYGGSHFLGSGSRQVDVTVSHRHAISLSVHLYGERLGFGIVQGRFVTFGAALLHISQEVFFCLAALVGLVLCRVHGIFKEFLIVFPKFPFVLFHQLAILVKGIGIVVLRVAVEEFTSFTFSFFHNFRCKLTRQFTGLAQQHIPNIIGNHTPTFFALLHGHYVHHGKVLHILAERSHQRWIAHTRPYVGHFIEEFDEQFILLHKRQVTFCLVLIDRFQIGFQVRH